ncbi:M14 family metallopeptidase [Ferrovibrio sp.]|uniref:M14 family metallopeptidase n=1 Tax=Ferrovibrio sp. TaxID=1917215 RepID=UPI0026193F66|nr:M14 family metallopeptidase [Ferrovibrio sp.]
MTVESYFSATYSEARQKFVAAAEAAKAAFTVYENPNAKGPNGEILTTDVACVGPDDAERVYLTISGTHGAEGFCGSGSQIGHFRERLFEAMPANTKAIMIHAINPYGFAWLRRVTEDNVDLNRNFQDFSRPLPQNKAYEEVHDWLIPSHWEGQGRAAADQAILEYQQKHGAFAFQSAMSGGQYSRPDGLFFGGQKPTWSNDTFRRILREHVPASARKLVSIDFHTGLGPMGYGEPIYVGPGDQGYYDRAKTIFGPEVTNPNDGSSSSARVTGTVPEAFLDLPKSIEVTAIALEYGTQHWQQVTDALRGDHWLHAKGDLNSPLGKQLKQKIRDAFYTDTSPWKAAVFGRAADFALRAFRGLAD